MENYKENIEATRKNGLGSSDAAMVAKIGRTGNMSDSDKLRIAVMLGQAEKPDFKSREMELGDDIEMRMFKDIQSNFPNAVSNPLYVSPTLSEKYGFDVLNHIDVEIETEDRLVWIEIKASKHETADVMHNYTDQLDWHWLLLTEKAAQVKKIPALYLFHCPTEGLLNADGYNFANVRQVEIMQHDTAKFDAGLQMIADMLPDFVYVKPEIVEAYSLPAEIQEGIFAVKQAMERIKADQKIVDDFKDLIKHGMEFNGIKSIKCDAFTITYVAETETKTFDAKKYQAEHPAEYEHYLKVSKRKSSVTIK